MEKVKIGVADLDGKTQFTCCRPHAQPFGDGMKLHHLRDFVAIAKTGSLRAAGRDLGLQQSALTRSLRELEREMGVALVDRQARGTELTGAGRRFLTRAQVALEELRRGREEALQYAGEMQGKVTVGLSSAALLGLLPTAYADFRNACPQIALNILEGVFQLLEPQLRDGSIDFHVGPRPPAVPATFAVELLLQNHCCVVGRKGHPLRQARSLACLREASWIVTPLHARIDQELGDIFSASGVQPPLGMTQVNSMLAALVLLTTTNSLAILPVQWTDSPLFAEQLEALPVAEALAAPDIVLITRTGMPLTPAGELLSNVLRRAALPANRRAARCVETG